MGKGVEKGGGGSACVSLNGSKAIHVFSWLLFRERRAPAAVCRALGLLVLLALLWLFLAGRRGREERELRLFSLLPWPQGAGRLVSPLNCAPFPLMEAPKWSHVDQQKACVQDRAQSGSRNCGYWTSHWWLYMCRFHPFSVLKKLRVKMACRIDFNIIPSFILRYSLRIYLPFPSLFLIYILLWHFMLFIVSYLKLFLEKWDIFKSLKNCMWAICVCLGGSLNTWKESYSLGVKICNKTQISLSLGAP